MVVVEAAARGTPSIVVEEEDNAAVELVTDGVNGIIAASARPDDLAAAIVAVHRAGHDLRRSTAAWFTAQRARALPGHVAGARRRRLQRALVGGVRQLRRPPPREAGGALAAAGGEALGERMIVEQPPHRAGDRSRVLGIEEQRRVARDLG